MTAYYTRYTKTCEICGKEFVARRSNARFCTATCRKRNSRRKESIERTGSNILASISALNRDREKHPDLAPLIDEIRASIVDWASAPGDKCDNGHSHDNHQVQVSARLCNQPGRIVASVELAPEVCSTLRALYDAGLKEVQLVYCDVPVRDA